MRQVSFDPETLPLERKVEWDRWSARASTASGKLKTIYGPGERPTFNAEIWKDLKEWFFQHVFDGKCAYCEGETEIVAVGDGEHWRPKGAVTKLDGETVRDAEGVAHPGYYWLAYEWRNLLPACERCNRGHGKGTRFPIKGAYIFAPDEVGSYEKMEAREEPLLLHPFGEKDPADHIAFNELGQPVGLTDEGDASIAVCNLERDPLNRSRQKRREHMANVADRVFFKWLGLRDSPAPAALDDLVADSVKDDDDFSLARRVYLVDHVRARIDQLQAERP